MIRQNKKRILLIKRFKKDILGNVIFKRKKILIKNFLYSLKRKKKFDFYKVGYVPRPFYFKRKTKFCKYFLRRQQFRLFYSFLKIKVLRKIIKKSFKRKNSVTLFLYFLETRLDVLLFRLNLVNSIRMARLFIFYGFILVNNRIEKRFFYNLKKKEILNFHPKIFFFLKKKINRNIENNNYLLLRIPNYIEYDLNKLFFIFSKMNKFDVYFIYKMNIYSFFSLIFFYKRCIF
jgi:ribosomal protein S4